MYKAISLLSIPLPSYCLGFIGSLVSLPFYTRSLKMWSSNLVISAGNLFTLPFGSGSGEGLNVYGACALSVFLPCKTSSILMNYRLFSYPALRTNKYERYLSRSFIGWQLHLTLWAWGWGFMCHCCFGFFFFHFIFEVGSLQPRLPMLPLWILVDPPCSASAMSHCDQFNSVLARMIQMNTVR